MSELKFCPECGAGLVPGDRFCGDCGFDTQTLAAPGAIPPPKAASPATPSPTEPKASSADAPQASQLSAPPGAVQPPLSSGANSARPAYSPPAPPASQPSLGRAGSGPSMGVGPGGGGTGNLGRGSGGNKNALVIMISLLALVFLGGGGVFWWLSRGEQPDPAANRATPAPGSSVTTPANQAPQPAPTIDLSRAATYLSQPGLKCTFLVNYPDGTTGVVERTSARLVSHEAVRISEVETGVDQGETFGYGFHYVERPDGTYYILDQTPDEIFPVLKNNLTVGQTWQYQDSSGQIKWTVMDMGVRLDLGFTAFDNCLVVYEDNQAVQYQALTYYAPGRGIVAVKPPGGKDDYYKMTAITSIDAAQAAATVKKWSPNHAIIKDDRTQS